MRAPISSSSPLFDAAAFDRVRCLVDMVEFCKYSRIFDLCQKARQYSYVLTPFYPQKEMAVRVFALLTVHETGIASPMGCPFSSPPLTLTKVAHN
eukprot:scaffold2874_cov136-Skeletonema_menzelii.AAC.1